MKNVNCRVSNPPPDVHTAKVALLHTSPSAIHPTRIRCCNAGNLATHHNVAAMVPAVKATDNHGATCSGRRPNAPHNAANSRTHRKLEYPSTYSPRLNTKPWPSNRLRT